MRALSMLRKNLSSHPRFLLLALFLVFLLSVLALLSAQGAMANYAFRFPVGGKILLDPVIDQGRVWILAEGRQLYTMRENGVVTGKGQTSVKNPSLIVPDGFGRALISDGTGTAELINQLGKPVWSVKLNGILALPPFFDQHGALYLCAGGNIVVYTPAGKIREFFSLPEGQALFAAPVHEDNADKLFIVLAENTGGARLVLVSEERKVTREWRFSGMPSLVSCDSQGYAAVVGKTLWFADWQDDAVQPLYEFNAQIIDCSRTEDSLLVLLANRTIALLSDGKLAWQVQTKISSPASVRLTKERVFVYNTAMIQSFSLSGELFRELSVTNSTTRLVPGLSGNVFSGGADWIVYVYQFEALTITDAQSERDKTLQELTTALEKELFWLSSGYTDASFIPVLEEVRLAVSKLQPVSQRNKLLVLALAAAPDLSGIPDPGKNLSIPLRADACRLLGMLGDPMSIPLLVTVAVTETDETLVSAALDAIADISIDPSDTALERLAKEFKVTRSVETAYALIRCVTTLTRSQGNAKNLNALALLTKLQDQRFPDSVRKKAQEALTSLLR